MESACVLGRVNKMVNKKTVDKLSDRDGCLLYECSFFICYDKEVAYSPIETKTQEQRANS